MPLTRRDFINATAAAAAYQTRAAEPAPGWFDRPMRWAQLTLVEDDPGKYDLALLAGLFPPHPLRRRLPERRRLRGLLSDQDPAALPQPVAGRHATRSAIWWPAAAS